MKLNCWIFLCFMNRSTIMQSNNFENFCSFSPKLNTISLLCKWDISASAVLHRWLTSSTKKRVNSRRQKKKSETRNGKKEPVTQEGTGTWDDAEIKRKMQSSYLNLTTESKQMRRKVSNNLWGHLHPATLCATTGSDIFQSLMTRGVT